MNKHPHIAHVDWSIHAGKRWFAEAVLKNGQYYAGAAQLWHGEERLFAANAFVGFDFPLGLPLSYAEQLDVVNFRAWLTQIPRLFFDVADSAETISLQRPFYPARPGGTKQQHLLDALHVAHINALRRQCELATDMRRAAAPMFWTLGAQQVGKAMLTGWREVILPNLNHLALWPFDGDLTALLNRNRPVIAESYPGEFYHHLGLTLIGSKRKQETRRNCANTLLNWAKVNEVVIENELLAQIESGFGGSAEGEDQFDAIVGLFGMINVVIGNRTAAPMLTAPQRLIEGWILGQH